MADTVAELLKPYAADPEGNAAAIATIGSNNVPSMTLKAAQASAARGSKLRRHFLSTVHTQWAALVTSDGATWSQHPKLRGL